MDQNFVSVEITVMGTRTWILFSVLSFRTLYNTYYMMLPDQCGHIVMKVLATVTWLNEDKIHVCLSRDWNTLLPLPKTLPIFHFQFCKFLNQLVLQKLSIVGITTAAIWLLFFFLNKWIWKTNGANFFCTCIPKKELSRESNRKRINVLSWKNHVTMNK